jgi:hypothetical protein
MQSTPPPGALVLYFPTLWQAPDKEQLHGFVQYDATKNAYSNLIIPTSPAFPVVFNNTLSPDGKYILATQSTGSTTSLVAYSLSQQGAVYTIDTQPFGSLFKVPVWSPDGSHVAYQVMQLPSRGTKAASSTPRYSSFIAKVDGTDKTQLGAMLPVMFSPDSSQILSIPGDGIQTFQISSVADPRSGTEISPSALGIANAGPMLFDQTGKHMALATKETGWVIYSLDWKDKRIVKIDVTKDVADQAVFGQDGEFLTVSNEQKTATVYRFNPVNSGVYVNSYPLALPGSSILVDWMPNAK